MITGTPPVLDYLDIDDLTVNISYQRGTDSDRSKKLVADIARHFDWSKFHAILVARSPSGKKYSIVDGQHRVLGALARGDIEKVPCCILDLPDIADQANCFVGVNKARVALHPMQIFRASVAAGDKSAIALKSFLDSIGMVVPPSPRTGGLTKPNEVQAISMLRRIHKRTGGPAALSFALTAIREAYPEELGQMRSLTVQCLTELYFQRGGALDRSAVITALRETDPETLQEQGREHHKKYRGGVLRAMTAIFCAEYNRHAPVSARIVAEVSHERS